METEIILSPLQKAKQKYYLKKKSDPKYIETRRMHCNKYYHTHKNEPGFKERVSAYNKIYYANLNDILLDIIV